MSKRTSVMIAGIVVLSIYIVVACGLLVVQAAKRPLASPLGLQINPTIQNSSAQTRVNPGPVPEAQSQVDLPEPAFQDTCGLSGTSTVLFLGRDAEHWMPPYGADAIRVARFDFDRRTLTIFAFQRYLWVATPNLQANYGLNGSTLGDIYTTVVNKERNNPDADIIATRAIAQTLYDNFGVIPEHYVTIKENLPAKVIDTLGGIDITVPVDVKSDTITIPAGEQHLNGKMAEIYIRDLDRIEDEWIRLERQNTVFQVVRARMLQPDIITKIPELYENFRGDFITDFSTELVLQLSCVMQGVTVGNIRFDTVRYENALFQPDKRIMIKDLDVLKQQLRDLGF